MTAAQEAACLIAIVLLLVAIVPFWLRDELERWK